MKLRTFALASLAVATLLAPGITALMPLPGLPPAPLQMPGLPNPAAHVGGPYNGVGSYQPASTYDAPIFRQFAFVEGHLTQYHVLSPDAFLMDAHHSHIYQFPECQTLQPVLERHEPGTGGGDPGPLVPHDAPTREIVDVVLSTGCSVQPKSVADINALAAPGGIVERPGMFVNAPMIPKQLMGLSDQQLYSGPPFRPRIAAWQEGAAVQFITYEVSWMNPWLGINWPGSDGQSADVFMISYGAVYRPDFSIFNTASGTPLDPGSFNKYSPMWHANCIVDSDNPKCMVSVNKRDPAYFQCRSVAQCESMTNSKGHQVEHRLSTTFTHINCPMVAVDLDGNDYISANEEILFPDVWVNGPVTVL